MATLESDPSRSNEPFIRLPAPHTSIHITPPRPSDIEAFKNCFNDPRIYQTILGPPIPYTQADADSRYPMLSKNCAEALQQFHEIQAGERKWTSGSPFRVLREVDAVTEEQTFLGELTFQRYTYSQLMDEGEKMASKRANNELEDGDPKIIWQVGVYSIPTHHNRGIMTAALRAIMDVYMVPYMNIHRVWISCFEHNIGSRRVFEKNGFVFQGVLPEPFKLPDSKGGGSVRREFFKWERKEQ